MSQIAKKGIIILLPVLILAIAGCSSQNSKSSVDPDTGKHTVADWSNPDSHGAWVKLSQTEGGLASCQECHGEDFSGGISDTACSSCHGVNAPHPQDWTSGARKHSSVDQSNAAVCAVCHTDGANSPIQPAQPLPGAAPGCFNNTLCHDQNVGHAAGWADASVHGASVKSLANGFSNCKTCHGSDFTGGTSTIACSSCHGASAPHPPTPWIYTSPTATRTHTSTDTGNASVCADCHTDGANLTSIPAPPTPPAGTPVDCFNNTLCHAQVGHEAGWASPDSHGSAAKSAPSTTDMKGFSRCQDCHAADFTGGANTSCFTCHTTAPHSPAPWNGTRTHSATDEGNAAVCDQCHHLGANSWLKPNPPNTTGQPDCFNNTLCHATPPGCVECHSSVQTGTHGTPRDAVVGEFGLAWGHKKSGRGQVADADCIVCHLEGNYSTQKPSAMHKDGNIDLRDPDGSGEQPIKDNNGNPFTFTKYSIGYSFGDRTTTLGNTIAEVITVQFCMKCHDSGGATNTTARSNNGGTGTAEMPFGGVALGANYTATNGAIGTQGLIDVATQFAAGNSSRHPVGAPNSRMYPYSDRLAVPYNNIGTDRDSNTQANNSGSPRVAANSVVMVCDDCHTTGTSLTDRTITAHGNASSLRGAFFVTSATQMCMDCHVAGSTTSGYPGRTNFGVHDTGSAFSMIGGGDEDRPDNALPRCNFCHFSNPNTYDAANRPRYAQDIHGFNEIYGTTAGWTAGNANGMRPVAFMRNAYIASATLQGSWANGRSPRPYSASGITAGQANCGGSFAFNGGNSGISCSSNGHNSYQPGGSF